MKQQSRASRPLRPLGSYVASWKRRAWKNFFFFFFWWLCWPTTSLTLTVGRGIRLEQGVGSQQEETAVSWGSPVPPPLPPPYFGPFWGHTGAGCSHSARRGLLPWGRESPQEQATDLKRKIMGFSGIHIDPQRRKASICLF